MSDELTNSELCRTGRKIARGELLAPVESDIIFALEQAHDTKTLGKLGTLFRHRGLQIISSPGGSAEADEALQVLSRHTDVTSGYEDMYG